MSSEVMKSSEGGLIRQISVFADNKVGRLNDLIGILGRHQVHVLALSTQESTDSTIIRLIVDDPGAACHLFQENRYSYIESALVGVEIDRESQLRQVFAILVQVEINIHYVYPFIIRPGGKSALAICLEDNELAIEVLKQHYLKVITQGDITR